MFTNNLPTQIRRCQDGSIDYCYYTEVGMKSRSQYFAGVAHALVQSLKISKTAVRPALVSLALGMMAILVLP